MGIAVFDVDGVVADVRHRLHYLEQWQDWQAFFDEAEDDPLLTEGATLVAKAAAEHDIVWLTGRPEWLRAVTQDWFAEHGLPAGELIMRPMRDFRPAVRFKLSVLEQLSPRGIEMLVDDDPAVVRAATRAGFPAVLAEWVPREEVLDDAQERFGRT